MQIKAALLRQPNTPFTIETLTLDDPHAGEVRVKLTAFGVCHSDYHLVSGTTKHPTPGLTGHGGAGRAEWAAGAARAGVGQSQ